MLSFTILTTEAYEGIRDLHTRMPMMLAKDGLEAWLAGENPVIDPVSMRRYQSDLLSPKMNSPKHNEPDCIETLVA